MRQAANRGAYIRRHTPAEAVDLAAQRAAWLRHHVDGRALSRLHSREVGLAEIADRIPVLGVDDREQRVAGGGELPSCDVERGDPAIAGRTHDRLVEVALRQCERRARALQLRLGGLGVGNGLARLVGLQLRLLQRDLRGALRRARLVDLLRGDEALPEQRLQPPQRARSESPLRLGAADAAFGGTGLGGLRRDLVGSQGKLRLQAAHRRASLVHPHSVRFRVDPEHHVALAHRLVVAHVELDDPAADVGRQVDEVGLQIGIVSAWPLIDPARCEDYGHQEADQRDEADQDAERLSKSQHRSVTEPEQPGKQRGRDREARVGQQRGDDVVVDAGQREDLPADDCGDNADCRAQHPGREVGAEQIHCRRATARGDRQHDRDSPRG